MPLCGSAPSNLRAARLPFHDAMLLNGEAGGSASRRSSTTTATSVRPSPTEAAVEKKVAISSDDFQTLDLCLDNAIAGAVTEFSRQH